LKKFILLILAACLLSSCTIGDGSVTETESETEKKEEITIVIPDIPDQIKYCYDASDVDINGMKCFSISGTDMYYSYVTTEISSLLRIDNSFISVKLAGEYVSLSDIDVSVYLHHDNKNTLLYVDNRYLPGNEYEFRFENKSSFYSFVLLLDNINKFSARTEINNDHTEYGIPENTSAIVDAWMPVDGESFGRGLSYALNEFDHKLLKEIILDHSGEQGPLNIKATSGEFDCFAAERVYIRKYGDDTELNEEMLLSKYGAHFTCCSNGAYVWIENLWKTEADKTFEDGIYEFIYEYKDGYFFILKDYVKQNFYDHIYTYESDIHM